MDAICRLQDLRRIPSEFKEFLNDPDPAVRARATLAFGSLQDTTALGFLLDRLRDDPDQSVQYAAAFSIGQTGGQLSPAGRDSFYQSLGKNLDRLPRSPESGNGPRGRLIEEIGKFGSEKSLDDLILRCGSSPDDVVPLTMSIARCAIRGVVSLNGVRFVLKHVSEDAVWQTAYALQRIGDHPEFHRELAKILPLCGHSDPLVRMNIATLLGKLKDTAALATLTNIAESDGDWRVRVNALKSLANFNLEQRPGILRLFRRSFSSESVVALTATSSFGNLKFSSLMRTPDQSAAVGELARIAVNEDKKSPWQVQAAAAATLAKIEGPSSFSIINRALASESPRMPLW